MIHNGRNYIRVNISDSSLFIPSEVAPGELKLYPDLEADLWVVHPVINEFTLLLYGRDLSNRIIDTFQPSEIDETCYLPDSPISTRQALIVDQQSRLTGIATTCEWECVHSAEGRCLAGTLSTPE
jgi:hypothetical protein